MLNNYINLPAGQVFGPYMNGKDYCITKAMGRKSGTSAKASHILISYEGTQVPNKKEKRTKEQAKAKAESLLAQVQANPSSFLMLALTNSDDSSAQQGGDLGYFSPGQMVKPFNDFVFNNSVGKIGLVETDFGFHIINVTDKQDAVFVWQQFLKKLNHLKLLLIKFTHKLLSLKWMLTKKILLLLLKLKN
jgi:peptidyl-prolyl cis-trans isomerase D